MWKQISALAMSGALWLVLSLFCATARSDESVGNSVVAAVNEEPVLLSEVLRRAGPVLQRMSASSYKNRSVRVKVLRDAFWMVVDDKVTRAAAEYWSIAASAADIDALIARMASDANMPIADYVAFILRDQKTDETSFRATCELALLNRMLKFAEVRTAFIAVASKA